jgi:DNA repair protein RecO (recombination protein O)
VSALHTEGLLLRAVDFGESDRIVHLLTPETGRLAAIAKGARRSRRRFPGTLDLFNHLRVQVERRRPGALARLEHARLVQGFVGIRESSRRFALACYLVEMLDRLAPEGGARADLRALFAFARSALAVLESQEPDARLRTWLELRSLDALGLRPELRRCVRCGSDVGAHGAAQAPPARPAAAQVGFHIGEGGPVCTRCTGAADALLPVHVGTLRALERSLSFDMAQLDRLALGGAALREARTLVARFLRFHVGLELRSERFLEERLTPTGAEGTLLAPEAPRRE